MKISLKRLEDCIDNKESLFNIIEGKNIKLIIEKYQFIPNYDIKVINKLGTCVIHWYRNLSAFDCYNMIQELLSPLNDK